MKRVEVGVITFGPVATLADFHTADAFDPPQLSTAKGLYVTSGAAQNCKERLT